MYINTHICIQRDRHTCKAAALASSQAQDYLLVFPRKLHFRATFKEGKKKAEKLHNYKIACCNSDSHSLLWPVCSPLQGWHKLYIG